MNEIYQTIVNVPVYKRYTVKRITFKNSVYEGETEWLAQWFYNNMDNYSDNILIEIKGDFHQTFPNRPHLSVRFKSNDLWTGVYHMSVDQNGFVYAQPLNVVKKGKMKKKKKSKKKKGKKLKGRIVNHDESIEDTIMMDLGEDDIYREYDTGHNINFCINPSRNMRIIIDGEEYSIQELIIEENNVKIKVLFEQGVIITYEISNDYDIVKKGLLNMEED